MTITNSAGARVRSAPLAPLGPRLLFGSATFSALAGVALADVWMPKDLMLAAVSASLFGLAGVTALAAWRRPAFRDPQPSYLNVAGALVLVGICIAALIEAQEMVRLIDELHR